MINEGIKQLLKQKARNLVFSIVRLYFSCLLIAHPPAEQYCVESEILEMESLFGYLFSSANVQ